MGRSEDELKFVPYIVDEIHKRAMKGDNPIYINSSHLLDDNLDSIKVEHPDLVKRSSIYSKQLISKRLIKFGFNRTPTKHHNPLYLLKW